MTVINHQSSSFSPLVTAAGYKVDFASPKGGKAPLDPGSVEASKDDPVSVKFNTDPATLALVANTSVLADAKVDDYDAVFYVGGHGKLCHFYHFEAHR